MIKATVIQDSYYKDSPRILTFELEYPRFIHSELMTHRVFSRNAASSRAIPISAMHDIIRKQPASPIHWGKNQAGMSAREELQDFSLKMAKSLWEMAGESAIKWSARLAEVGAHKQIANRVTEPFQIMKTIVTATEWRNWFDLRAHEDAQPEIHELAVKMKEAMGVSSPFLLEKDEWHVPYIHRNRVHLDGPVIYTDSHNQILKAEDARIISASCCAQVSYRKNDDTLDKAKAIFNRLMDSNPRHASPVEHQATPLITGVYPNATHPMHWPEGMTHMDVKGNAWSGNFQGWIQWRQIL